MRAAHRNLFDVLRLVAALLVFYAHLFPLFGLPGPDRVVRLFHFVSGGSLGVGIFFAISGYLVTQSLERSKGVAGFYGRRALRILPALAVVLALTVFVAGPLLTTLGLRDYFANGRTVDYLFYNLLLDLRVYLPGVFETNPYKGTVNGSLWTLQSEAALYLVLPVLIRMTADRRRSMLIASLAFGCLFFWFSRYARDVSVGLLGPMVEVTRNATIFCVGSVIAATEGWRLSPRQIAAMALLFLATATTTYGDLLFLVLLPVLVVGIGMTRTRFQMPFGADISYGFYLYSFPVQQTVYQTLSGRIGDRAMAAVALVVAMTFAIASWFLVEGPILRLRGRKPASVAAAAPGRSEVVL